MAEFLVATELCRFPRNVSRQALIYGKLGRWLSRDSTLNWKLLEASMH